MRISAWAYGESRIFLFRPAPSASAYGGSVDPSSLLISHNPASPQKSESVALSFRTRARMQIEILALRHQLAALQRQKKRVRL